MNPSTLATTFLHKVDEAHTICCGLAIDEQQGLRRIRSMQQTGNVWHRLRFSASQGFQLLLPRSLSIHAAFDGCPAPHGTQEDSAAHRKRAACGRHGASSTPHSTPTLAATISSVCASGRLANLLKSGSCVLQTSTTTAFTARPQILSLFATATTQRSLDHTSLWTQPSKTTTPLFFYTSPQSLHFDLQRHLASSDMTRA